MSSASNITNYGTLRSKIFNAKNIHAGYQASTPANLNLRSNNSTAVLNRLAYLNAELAFVASGASTLKMVEFESDGQPTPAPQIANDSTALNVKLRGLKDPTIDQGACTKAYADSKMSNYITIYPPVYATSSQNLQGITGYVAYSTTGGAGNRPCIKFDIAPGGPVTAKNDGVNITMDGTVVNLNQSVLLTNTLGAGTANTGEGVYEITTIQSASPNLTFTRRADMLGPLNKGAFVLVEPGADTAGNGYYLTLNVPDISSPRLWELFSTSSGLLFDDVIIKSRTDGSFTVTSDIGGADEGKLLTVGATDGKTEFSYTVGKPAEAFGINATNTTITEGGTWTNDSVGLVFTTPTFKFNPDPASLANDRTVNLTNTSASEATVVAANSSIFATLNTGTPVRTLANTTAVNAKIDGHVTALTNSFASNGNNEYGGGLMFDTKNVTSSAGSSNANLNRILILPHKSTTDTFTLDVVAYNNAGVAQTVAEFSA